MTLFDEIKKFIGESLTDEMEYARYVEANELLAKLDETERLLSEESERLRIALASCTCRNCSERKALAEGRVA